MKTKYSIALAAALLSGESSADIADEIQFHGFASQAIVHTSNNNFFGTSDNTSFEFTEIGLGSSIAFSPNLQGAVQIGARAAGNTAEIDDPQLDFAVLNYSTNLGDDKETYGGIRIGRFRNPIGIHNETRDVLATRESVMLPQSGYFDALGFRDFFISSDGALLHLGRSHDNLLWRLEMFASNPRDDSDGAKAELIGTADSNSIPGDLSGKPFYGMRAVLELNQQWAIVFSGLKYKSNYEAVGTPDAGNLSDGAVDIDYSMLSIVREAEFLTLSSEFVIAELDRSGFDSNPRGSHSLASGYIRADYRITDSVTPFITYEHYVYDRDDPNGTGVEAATGGFLPAHYLYQRDLTIGSSWEIDQRWYFAAEYHYVVGTSLLSVLDNPNLGGAGTAADGPVGGHKYWTMATAMISYRF